MEEFGSIMLEKNICFKKKDRDKKNTYLLDHAYKKGRPVLIIASDEDYYYYLTMTSKGTNKNGEKHKNSFYLNNNSIDSNFFRESYVNVEDIYRKRICGYEEKGYIDYNTMQDLIKYMINYQTEIKKDEYFDDIYPSLQQHIDNIKVKKR